MAAQVFVGGFVELRALEAGERITIRCFTHDPSVNSSLKFLRKTEWARAKVESLYLHSVAHPRKTKAEA